MSRHPRNPTSISSLKQYPDSIYRVVSTTFDVKNDGDVAVLVIRYGPRVVLHESCPC